MPSANPPNSNISVPELVILCIKYSRKTFFYMCKGLSSNKPTILRVKGHWPFTVTEMHPTYNHWYIY